MLTYMPPLVCFFFILSTGEYINLFLNRDKWERETKTHFGSGALSGLMLDLGLLKIGYGVVFSYS